MLQIQNRKFNYYTIKILQKDYNYNNLKIGENLRIKRNHHIINVKIDTHNINNIYQNKIIQIQKSRHPKIK